MALNKTTLGDKLKQAKNDHKARINNNQDIDTSTDTFFEDIAKAIVDHIDQEGEIKGGIVVRDGSGNQIGTTDKTNKGVID